MHKSNKSKMKMLQIKPTLLATLLACANLTAWAVEPFVLKDIRVEGLQRADAGAVFASLPFRVGDTYNDDKGAAGLRSLFATGLFKDVRLQVDGNVLVVLVEERPIVARVDFTGTKEFDSAALIKALKDIGIGEGQPFDRALADRAEQELKRQYLSRSLYGADVVTTITPVEKNRVNVTFSVSEGEVTKIKSIRVTGTSAFSESKILGLMDMSDGGWLTWYTKSDQYARAKLNADLENIKAYYQNRGYLDFRIESTQVTMSPDKQSIAITINVSEGIKYTVTGVRLSGDFLGKEDEFRSLVKVTPSEPYKAEDVSSTINAFADKFAGFGYAFASIQFKPVADREKGQVLAEFVAQPQRRAYVRRINVSGNTRTRDEVIRREFRQFESAWYDGQKIKLSRDRVDRLGFFKQVAVDTSPVSGTSDQVDLTVNVEEKPTGNLLLGAGFSSADKLSLSASIKQENVFGSGNYLGLELNTSKTNRTLVLSTLDPYFTDSGVSRALDIYYRTSSPLSSQTGDYKIVTPGAKVRFGVPFNEYDTVYFGIGVEQTEIRGTDLPSVYEDYRKDFGDKSISVPLTVAWSRDNRDSLLVPTEGRFQSATIEWGAAGDTNYLRTDYQLQQYIPISNRFTLMLNGQIGWGEGLSGKKFPVTKNYYGGGLGTVRGFEQSTLGTPDVKGSFNGGNKRINLNAELYVPFPGSGNDRTLRAFSYADAGNVWTSDEHVSLQDFRASVGLGLSWISPVGPLKISFGVPVKSSPKDRIQKVQFQIGSAF